MLAHVPHFLAQWKPIAMSYLTFLGISQYQPYCAASLALYNSRCSTFALNLQNQQEGEIKSLSDESLAERPCRSSATLPINETTQAIIKKVLTYRFYLC
jgi:hypothetical protein